MRGARSKAHAGGGARDATRVGSYVRPNERPDNCGTYVVTAVPRCRLSLDEEHPDQAVEAGRLRGKSLLLDQAANLGASADYLAVLDRRSDESRQDRQLSEQVPQFVGHGAQSRPTRRLAVWVNRPGPDTRGLRYAADYRRSRWCRTMSTSAVAATAITNHRTNSGGMVGALRRPRADARGRTVATEGAVTTVRRMKGRERHVKESQP